ncbi:MAG TPA: ATP-binding protein [bacterium]|nr:ATP-binding protein [bacterium]HOL47936.1 ATP-binding protein [bacterium]HPQ19399.1 ATP-binding protein [bacterium]
MRGKTYKILIIEDDNNYLELIEELLNNYTKNKKNVSTFELYKANTLKEGLELLTKEKIDLIILDLILPDIEGLEGIEKTKFHFPDIPLIVLTNVYSDENAIEALKFGAQDYLFKGQINSEILVRAIVYSIERNRLTLELANYTKQLEIAYSKLRESEQQLKEKNEKLQELNEMKDYFLSIVSHQIRTNITIISCAAENISSGMFGSVNEKQAKFLDMIKQNINNLIKLVNNLLDLAKFESGKFELNKQPENIVKIIEQSIQDFRMVALEKNIKVLFSTSAKEIIVKIDVNLILQVFANLMNNAIKYTEENGTIEVEIYKDEKNVYCSVKDNGIGISNEDLKKIFNKYKQVGKKDRKGTGLGLVICKEIIKAHKGEIKVESELNKGSKFTFSLPLNNCK